MSDGVVDILNPSMSLKWKEWPSLPVKMKNAQSVWLDGTLHVGGGITSGDLRAAVRLYSLRPGVDSAWTVRDTPTYFYALAVYNSELLLMGGRVYPTEEITNKVFTMKDGKFHESHPPMREVRMSPSVVNNGSALVVAGGLGPSGRLSFVEVLKDGQWMTAPSIPSAGGWMKSALHGDLWYIIQRNTKDVFCVSLQSLTSGTVSLPWKTLPDAPNKCSAAAFFGGCLLSIGGGEIRKATAAIHALSSNSQSWKHVANLPVPVKQSSAVVLSTGELLVIGGDDKGNNPFATIYGAFLSEFPSASLMSVEQSPTSLPLPPTTHFQTPPHWNTRSQQWSQSDKKKLGLQDLSEVYSALYSAADKWYNFGLTFGIDPVQLKTIQSSESNDQARLHEMLSKWLDSSTCPTWTDICNGLRTNTVEKVSLVQIIEQKYCSKESPNQLSSTGGRRLKRVSTTTPDTEQGSTDNKRPCLDPTSEDTSEQLD